MNDAQFERLMTALNSGTGYIPYSDITKVANSLEIIAGFCLYIKAEQNRRKGNEKDTE